MLNKIACLLFVLFSFNVQAVEAKGALEKTPDIEVMPIGLEISEPFTGLAILSVEIRNNTNSDIEIGKLHSDNARRVEIFEIYENDFGAKLKKRVRNLFLPQKSITGFYKKGKYQIMLTGLKKAYNPGDELMVIMNFEGQPAQKFYAKVIPAN